jgi:hypothetical protein
METVLIVVLVMFLLGGGGWGLFPMAPVARWDPLPCPVGAAGWEGPAEARPRSRAAALRRVLNPFERRSRGSSPERARAGVRLARDREPQYR